MDRKRRIGTARRRLMRLHSPRLQMALIVALTVSAGFLASVSLLEIGLAALVQRYALSVLIAYLVFLLLLRSWVRLHDGSLGLHGSQGAGPEGRRTQRARTAQEDAPSRDVGDGPPGDIGDDAEAMLVLVAIAVLGGALFSALGVVWIAPRLLVELLAGAALGVLLYRPLRGIESADPLRTGLRRTLVPFILALALCAGAGAVTQHLMPEARTVGDLLHGSIG